VFDGVMDLLPKGKGGGTIGRMFAGIKDVFKPLTKIGDTLGAAFKPIKTLLGSGKEGSGILKSMGAFLKGGMIEQVFKAFAKVGKAIAAPLAIIMGIVDGFFESKDAISKSDGVMAKLVNGIVGAIGGFVDGAIFQLLDLIKSGISWLAGAFGFTEVEKLLDSFSLSEMFNDALDGIYKFVNKLFAFEDTSFLGIFKSLIDIVLAPLGLVMNFLKGLFKWGDPNEPWTFTGMVTDVFNSAIKWFKDLFADPVGTLTTTLSTLAGAYLTIGDFIIWPLKKAIAWLLGLFGWDEAAEKAETFSFKDTVFGVFNKAIEWIKGIFADPVEGLTTLLGTIAKKVPTPVAIVPSRVVNPSTGSAKIPLIHSIALLNTPKTVSLNENVSAFSAASSHPNSPRSHAIAFFNGQIIKSPIVRYAPARVERVVVNVPTGSANKSLNHFIAELKTSVTMPVKVQGSFGSPHLNKPLRKFITSPSGASTISIRDLNIPRNEVSSNAKSLLTNLYIPSRASLNISEREKLSSNFSTSVNPNAPASQDIPDLIRSKS
jgi:hypothetical protein